MPATGNQSLTRGVFVRVTSWLSSLERNGVIRKRRDNRVEEVGRGNNDRVPLGSVVKEQLVPRQMLVCYESILTGESRAF